MHTLWSAFEIQVYFRFLKVIQYDAFYHSLGTVFYKAVHTQDVIVSLLSFQRREDGTFFFGSM